MSATGQRNHATSLARIDSEKAYDNARQIQDPWFRTQALAAVLRYAPEDKVSLLAKRVFDSARDCNDAYRQVAVASWPVRALIERGEVRRAEPYLLDILTRVRHITPPPSEVEALFLLWNAVWIAPPLRQPTFALLLQTCGRANTWRAGRVMHAIVLIVAGEDRTLAESGLGTYAGEPLQATSPP
jgi:hypothetical protein